MDIKKQLKLPAAVSLVVLIIGVIFCIWGPFDVWISTLYTVFLAVISFVFISWLRIFTDLPKILDDRISKMIDFSALWTETNSFENSLEILRQKGAIGNRVKWLVAKFISYKLGKDFRDCNNAQIIIRNIDGDEYSHLLEHLIYECKDEVLMTCPYSTSKEWFKTLKISNCLSCENENSCTIVDILEKIPHHIMAIVNNKRPKKRIRLVTKKWNSPSTPQIKCREHFDKLSKKAKLKVWMSVGDQDLRDRDLNILDGVLIEWDKNNNECKLIIGTDEVSLLKLKFFEKQRLDALPKVSE